MKNKLLKRSTIEKKRSRWGWLFILPWFIGTVYFFIIPMLQSARYAFSDVTIRNGIVNYKFAGLENYIYIFTKDSNFLPGLAESIGNVLYQVPIIVIFSLFMALLIKSKFPGRTFFRAVFFFPVIIASGVAINILQTQVLMSSDAAGVQQQAYMFSVPSFTVLTEQLGLPTFVTELAASITGGFFNITWKSGVQMVLLLAAVNHISPSSYEAADIEGASQWEKLWKITFPMISPTLLVVLIYSIIDSFTDYGNKIMQMISEHFGKGYYEYSTAVGLVYFIVVLVLTGAVNLIFSKKVYYATQ
ncbi:MAG: sugar ABC transporter permease [Oscillospiraceae bacterium]|nr:sugar ABC transporter permease [Oscillospiraceae bacterium]